MKPKWKVQPAPTGRYKSFEKRGWPSLEFADGRVVGYIYSTAKESYVPRRVIDGTHAPLKFIMYDYSEGAQKRKSLRSKREFTSLDDAKRALEACVAANPDFIQKAQQ